MNLRKLFGLTPKQQVTDKPKQEEPYKYDDVLHMWEDDYLMIELLPKENLDFIMNETKRTAEFAKEHSDSAGFTDITPIGEIPIKTLDKRILIVQVELIFRDSGLQKIEKVIMQGVGLLDGEKAPLGYGSSKFAVILETESGLLKNIWLTGHTRTETERQNLKNGLKEFVRQFDFVGVDWFKSEYYDLNDDQQIEEFIKNSC